ncbi:MAG: MFS transporter, partial [Dehalococcoidia bacterium]|nr:MFS transporter [Dehalococcoidia bacterium]
GQPRGRPFYGWWVVLASSVMGMFGNGLVSSGFSRMFEPIRKDLELSYSSMSLVFSLARTEGGVGGPLVGWLTDKFGARPMVLAGGLIAGIGMMLLSRADTYWELVILFVGVVTAGKTAGMGQTLLALVNQWFVRRRALAMSTLMTAFAAGGALVVPLVHLGVEHLGWRGTLLYAGIFITLLTVPVSLVVRSRPEDMGLQPDGPEPARRGGSGLAKPQTLPPAGDFTVRQALRTQTFWFMLLGVVARVAAANAITIHLFPMMEWKGIDAGAATFYVTLMFALSVPLRFVLGIAGGRFSPRLLLFGGMNLGAVGVLAFIILDGPLAVILFVTGMALAEGISTVNWILLADYFGRARFASLMGLMSVFFNVGLFISPIYAGKVRDTTGGYDLVLIPFAALFVISSIMFALARRPALPAPKSQPSAPVVSGGE